MDQAARKWDRSMSRTFAPDIDGMRLDRALAATYPEHSRSFVARLIEDRRVSIDGKVVTKPSLRVSAGASVDVAVTTWRVHDVSTVAGA